MEGVGIIMCLMSLLVATTADFSCVCNYDVQLKVYTAMSEQASRLGYMYEFDCKALMPGGDSNQTWSALAFEHKLGYVKLSANVKIQMCAGDPAANATVTTHSKLRAAGSSTTTIIASTGSSVSLGAQTTFTTAPPSSAATAPPTSAATAPPTYVATSPPTSAATAPPTSAATAPPTSAATAPPSSAASALPSSTPTMAPSSTPTMAPSSTTTVTSAAVTTVTSPLASTFTTTPPSTTKTPTYPNTAGLASTTEHTISTTAASGATMTYVGSSTTASAASCPTSSSLTTTFQQSCYEFVLHHSTWNSAEADCRHKGGHLMHITSAVEQDFIAKYLFAHFNHEVWIGLNDRTVEEQFEWTSGAPLTYTHWDPDRKDFLFHGTENCVVMQPILKGTWDDRQCSGLLAAEHSYVCQYSGIDPGSVIIG